MSTAICAKQCPECGKATMLQAPQCRGCGHRFRTRFVVPFYREQALGSVLPPAIPLHPPCRSQAARTTRSPLLSVLGLTVFAGALLWLGLRTGQPLLGGASAAIPVQPPAHGQAEHLYETIGIAMSLYDMDQAAGSAGRVIPAPDPHTRLVSYDYPGQSVRVSLFRPDVTGDDYRVQEVALYQGKTLIGRHAEMN